MLADQLDYVVGVDPHRDSHAVGVVEVRSGVVVFETSVAADSGGYAEALRLRSSMRRVGVRSRSRAAGSYGAGLTRFLDRQRRAGVRGRPAAQAAALGREDGRARRGPGRSSVLAQERPAMPRSNGEREALRALMAAREGAVNAKRAGLCQLRDLLVTTPEPLRAELRPLTQARLLARLAATRPERRQDPELRGALLALRSVARRIQQLIVEERELAREIETADRASSHRSCSTSPASGRSSPPRSCSPGHTKAGSAARPRSPASPASPRSPPPPAKRSATDSTAAATDNSTEPCTRSSSPARRITPAHDRLHRTPNQRRQDPPRSQPLPQALPLRPGVARDGQTGTLARPYRSCCWAHRIYWANVLTVNQRPQAVVREVVRSARGRAEGRISRWN